MISFDDIILILTTWSLGTIHSNHASHRCKGYWLRISSSFSLIFFSSFFSPHISLQPYIYETVHTFSTNRQVGERHDPVAGWLHSHLIDSHLIQPNTHTRCSKNWMKQCHTTDKGPAAKCPSVPGFRCSLYLTLLANTTNLAIYHSKFVMFTIRKLELNWFHKSGML